jgi:hypothetical protein
MSTAKNASQECSHVAAGIQKAHVSGLSLGAAIGMVAGG